MLGHDPKTGDTHLRVVVVDGDSHYVGGIDGANDYTLAAELTDVGVGGYVDAGGTGALRIVVNLGTIHFVNGADGILVGAAGVNVVVVVTNLLVEEEVAIRVDGDVVGLHEGVELLAGAIRRIEHELVRELDPRGEGRRTLIEKAEQVLGDGIMKDDAIVVDLAVVGIDHDLTGSAGINGRRDVYECIQLGNVNITELPFGEEDILDLMKIRVRVGNGVVPSSSDDSDGSVGNGVTKNDHFLSFQRLL